MLYYRIHTRLWWLRLWWLRRLHGACHSFNPTMLGYILRRHPEYRTIRVFVETGTYKAATVRMMGAFFRERHSIELSYPLWSSAAEKYRRKKGLFIHLGDSASILPLLAENIREPVLFYLDAHWFASETSNKRVAEKNPMPLLKEVQAIEARHYPDIVVLDDIQEFGKNHAPDGVDPKGDWTNISVNLILDMFPDSRVKDHFVFEEKTKLALFLLP